MHSRSGSTTSSLARRVSFSALWPHLRTLLVLTHLLGIFLLALPYSGKLGSKKHWAKKKQQTEMRAWADRLGVDKEDFESFLWDLSQSYIAVRKRVVRPFLKYADYTGTRQGWSMFAHPRQRTGRFEIYIQVSDDWQLVYTSHSDKADWNQWQFEHNRVRKLAGRLASNPHQPAYTEMTRWIARQLAEDFPTATRAKISMMTWKSLGPEAVRAGKKPEVARTRNQEFDLEALR